MRCCCCGASVIFGTGSAVCDLGASSYRVVEESLDVLHSLLHDPFDASQSVLAMISITNFDF